jgi:hypothetical protein
VISKPDHRNDRVGNIRAGFESVLDGSLAVLTCEEVRNASNQDAREN